MRVSQALVLFAHLIALIGFSALCLTGKVDVISASVFAFSLILSFVNERFQKGYYLSQGIITALAFTLIVYVVLGMALFNAEVFDSILTFLIYTQVIKLLGRKGMRDYIQVFVLSFFHFLAGTILTVNLSYGVAFIVYVCVAIWAIMVFSMRKESIEASSGDDPNVVTPLFLSTTVIISFGIFVFTALLFVSIPRMQGGFLVNTFLKPEALKSGFSNEVKLGEVGEIKLDSSPVMRIRILDRKPGSLPGIIYWRGIALDEFDGTTWRVSSGNYRAHKSDGEGIIRVRKGGKRIVSQEIVTEPLDVDVLFAGSLPVGFRGVIGGRITDVNDSYILSSRASYRLKYVAYSDLSVPSAEDLRRDNRGDYPVSIKERYLKLPPLGERTKRLAIRITSLDKTPYDKVMSIKRYLRGNMKYTRTLKRGGGEFPIEDFLFESRAGHCEYFATAMVVLLREIGIPARIVNGFIGGEWNEYGGFFLVRESDAHSWVEVFFPEHGWVLFDPTPVGVGSSGFMENSGLSFIGLYLDYLRYRWSRYVVDFNGQDQVRLFQEMRNTWKWQKRDLENRSEFKLRGFDKGWLFASVFAFLVVWVLYTRSGVRYVFGYRGRRNERASIVYRKALSLLSKRGFRKPDFATPREFARGVIGIGGAEFLVFHELTEKYLSLRFSGCNAKSDLEELENLLDVLKKRIK